MKVKQTICMIALVLQYAIIYSQNGWVQIDDMPGNSGYMHGIEFNNTFYVFNSAYSDSANTYSFDPVQNKWKTLSKRPDSYYQEGFTLTKDLSGIYIVGGVSWSKPLDQIQKYDPSIDRYTTLTTLPTPRTDLVAVCMDNRIYTFGGWNADTFDFVGYDKVEVYNLSTNSWETKTSMPFPRNGMVGEAVNGKIYIIGGGSCRLCPGNSVFIYDPDSDSWTEGTPMPVELTHQRSVVLNGKIYCFGGTKGWGGGYDHVLKYDPIKDQWEELEHMPVKRWDMAVGILGETIYAAGGRVSMFVYKDVYTFFPLQSTHIGSDNNHLVKQFKLFQNYPNPFNAFTQIEYSVQEQGYVKLAIYDICGKEVIKLVDEIQQSGTYSVSFNSNELLSGQYFYRIQSNGLCETRKMTLLK